MSDPKLGQLIDAGTGRDAVHVAILPALALRRMMPGEKLKNGVVDPFLTAPVEPNSWYWIVLYPGTVTDMRHVWKAPGITDEVEPVESKPVRRSERDVWVGLAGHREVLHRSFDALPVPREEGK